MASPASTLALDRVPGVRALLPGGTAEPASLQASLELLQWIAFACMLADHIGFFALGQEQSWLRGVGRLTFPLFGIVFGWRLAELRRRDPRRSLMPMQLRLLLAALVSQGLFVFLLGFGELLNILFAFSAALAIVQLTDPPRPLGSRREVWARFAAAAAVLAGVGALVDYGPSGVMMLVAMAAFFRTGTVPAAAAVVLTVIAVSLLHPQHWGVLALPLAALVVSMRWGVGRPVRHLFYGLYPAHLLLVSAAKALA